MEIKHRISKSASNEMWSLALDAIPNLIEAKHLTQNNKKVPQFRSIRNQLKTDHVPPIHIEVAYERKDTGDIIIMKELDKLPVKAYPRSKYKKLYESVHVKVSQEITLFKNVT